MPKVPYPYEVIGKLVTGNGSLIPICSLSNSSLTPSLTVLHILLKMYLIGDKKNPFFGSFASNIIGSLSPSNFNSLADFFCSVELIF